MREETDTRQPEMLFIKSLSKVPLKNGKHEKEKRFPLPVLQNVKKHAKRKKDLHFALLSIEYTSSLIIQSLILSA